MTPGTLKCFVIADQSWDGLGEKRLLQRAPSEIIFYFFFLCGRRRAEVTLDGVWPNDKTTCTQIRSPERLTEMNYEGRLEKASRKQGARFLEYRPETGSWVFEVAHFSKYGLQDSDEEDDVPPKTDPKKLKTTMPLPPSRLQQTLPPSQQQVAPQAQVEQPAPINTHHHPPLPH